MAARHDVDTAWAALVLQSTSMGSDTTLIPSTSAEKARPIAFPITISAQPSGVVKTRDKNAPMDGGVLFQARATVFVPANVKLAAVRADLEKIAADLMVDLKLVPVEK